MSTNALNEIMSNYSDATTKMAFSIFGKAILQHVVADPSLATRLSVVAAMNTTMLATSPNTLHGRIARSAVIGVNIALMDEMINAIDTVRGVQDEGTMKIVSATFGDTEGEYPPDFSSRDGVVFNKANESLAPTATEEQKELLKADNAIAMPPAPSAKDKFEDKVVNKGEEKAEAAPTKTEDKACAKCGNTKKAHKFRLFSAVDTDADAIKEWHGKRLCGTCMDKLLNARQAAIKEEKAAAEAQGNIEKKMEELLNVEAQLEIKTEQLKSTENVPAPEGSVKAALKEAQLLEIKNNVQKLTLRRDNLEKAIVELEGKLKK